MYQRIRDLREDSGMTQKEIAKILHCSQQVYSNYELGQRDIPTELIIKIAGLFQTTTDYILEVESRKDIYPQMKYSCLKCGYSVLLAGCRRVICEKCKNRLVFEEYNESE